MSEQFSDAQVEAAALAYARNYGDDCEVSHKAMRLALAAASALAWRGIESAPRDGTRILGVAGVQVEVIYSGNNGEGWFNLNADFNWWNVWPPTHWQPLPAPPQARP